MGNKHKMTAEGHNLLLTAKKKKIEFSTSEHPYPESIQ